MNQVNLGSILLDPSHLKTRQPPRKLKAKLSVRSVAQRGKTRLARVSSEKRIDLQEFRPRIVSVRLDLQDSRRGCFTCEDLYAFYPTLIELRPRPAASPVSGSRKR